MASKGQTKRGEAHNTVHRHAGRRNVNALIGICVNMRMGIIRHNLSKTTEGLVGANGGQIELDGAVFRNLIMGDATSSQLV